MRSGEGRQIGSIGAESSFGNWVKDSLDGWLDGWLDGSRNGWLDGSVGDSADDLVILAISLSGALGLCMVLVVRSRWR